jgi:hypothetical protein
MNALPAPKGTDIIGRQGEPFATLPFGSEASVPVALDACGVIGLDVMNWLQFIGKFQRHFAVVGYEYDQFCNPALCRVG